MLERRSFLKTSLFLTGAALLPRGKVALASASPFPAGVVYTRDNPGKWKGKEGSHAPQATVDGLKVALLTAHPMSEKHYIVRHTLVAADGTVIGEKTFAPVDKEASSSFEAPGPGRYYATSFCNLHDFWLTEFTI